MNIFEVLQKDDDTWLYDDDELKNHVVSFYAQVYSSIVHGNNSLPSSSSFPVIIHQDLVMLNKVVSMEETRRALFSMGSYKSLGPDGYHPLFFKSQWEVVGHSIFEFV